MEGQGEVNSVPERAEIMRRLRRLEGQVRGIQKMLAEGRERKDVITQLLAIRGAVDEVGLLLLRDELNRCLVDAGGANGPASDQVQQLRDILHLWMRSGGSR
jgi:DNA-binding FrmR family transcriptional regulator